MLKCKRVIAALLLLVTLMTMVPVSTLAQEGEVTEPTEYTEPAAHVMGEETVLNPLYGDILTEADLVASEELPMLLADDTYTSLEEAAAAVAEAMMNRQTVITVYLETETAVPDARKVLMNMAMEHNGIPGQGDNLRFQYAGYKTTYSSSVSGGIYYSYIKYTMTYMTTAAQEAQVTAATAALRQQLGLSGKSVPEKIVAVYNWMCDNIDYDYAGLSNSDLLEYTAYDAIINRAAVCQGYANLFYRLMLEEGIDCRIVSGTSDGEPHAWNIVKIGDYYYNADATWDAEWKCKYFLRGSVNYRADHTLGSDYTTADFTARYPIDTEDYVFPMRSGSCGDSATWSLDNTGKLTISGTGAMKDYSSNTATPWYRYYSCINAVQVDSGITYIGNRAFQALNITKATVGKDVTAIGEYAFGSCRKLTSVSLPGGLATVARAAFYDCGKLTSVIYCGANWNGVSVGSSNTALTGASRKFHNYENGACTECGATCINGHTWLAATCTVPETCSACRLTRGEALGHSWVAADCTTPKTCSVCSATEGKANGHSWVAATCTEPKTCSVCTATSGSALGHKYVKGICSCCSAYEPGYKELQILAQPASVTVKYGNTAAATVKADGVGLKYTWYFTSSGKSTKFSKSSITSATYSPKMDDSRDGRKVYCVITDKYGNTLKSETATLSQAAKTPLAITAQPQSVKVELGEEASITVQATGDDLTYTWYFTSNGKSKKFSKSSVTGPTYTAVMNDSRDGRKVYCKITDLYGRTVKTKTVTLTQHTELAILSQPVSVTVAAGVKATVTVQAKGDGLTYRWYYRNKDTYIFAYSKACKGASYTAVMDDIRDGRQVYCVITDKRGETVVTNLVTLNQKPPTPLVITRQPTDVTVAAGETASTTVEATGDGLTYTWYYTTGGTATKFYKSSNTTATYSTTMDDARSGRKIYCKITDSHGKTVTTATVTLSMG